MLIGYIDSGGVRAYSQLIILKALMDKVAQLEQSQLDDDGNRVESSFHPIPWEEARKEGRGSFRTEPRIMTHRNVNGHVFTARHEKGEKVDANKLKTEKIFSRFHPYHYFDWIAGAGTGGSAALPFGPEYSANTLLDGMLSCLAVSG